MPTPMIYGLTRANLEAQLSSAIERRCWWAEDAIRADLRQLTKEEFPMRYEGEDEMWDALICLRRSFALMALAMLAIRDRSTLAEIPNTIAGPEFCRPEGFSIAPLDKGTSKLLQLKVVNGDVSCYVKTPEPFMFIYYKGTFGEVRTVYGLNLTKPASWKGRREAPKHALQPVDKLEIPNEIGGEG